MYSPTVTLMAGMADQAGAESPADWVVNSTGVDQSALPITRA